MEKYNTEVIDKIIVNSVEVNSALECFIVHIKSHKPLKIYFIEIENFIGEFDFKLEKYLDKFDNVKDKVIEAVDIGYDFEEMICDYIQNLVEYGLITLSPLNEI